MTSLIRRYGANGVGRDFVVGDVHGCFRRLSAELDQLRFDVHIDRLFSVGDLVDRGPESTDVANWLRQPWFHAVRGNHEQMALDYLVGDLDRDDYHHYGGNWFIKLPFLRQQQIAARFGALPVALEVETRSGLVGIVHGDCPFASWSELSEELDSQDAVLIAEVCMSSRERITSMNTSGVADVSRVFVGHTPVQRPMCLGNVHYIDTGAVFGRSLTIERIS